MNKAENLLQIGLLNVRELANSLEHKNHNDLLDSLNYLSNKKIVRLIHYVRNCLENKRREEVKEMISHLISKGYSFETIEIDRFPFHITEDKKIEIRDDIPF